jgi:endonuclease-3
MAKSTKSSASGNLFGDGHWVTAVQPLIDRYRGKQHPLDYKSIYQLVVMVVLSAQDSDKNINVVAKGLFVAFPDMAALSRATMETLIPHISKVRNFGNKANWLLSIAQQVQEDANIPLTMEGLTALPGVGRKSANVILREAGKPAAGVIVDLHVLRVAPRLGIASGTDPKKIEKQIMDAVPAKDWGEIGMAISFLGREICRPTNPKCGECPMNTACDHVRANG